MTDEQWIDLARCAVACEGWRWMPGMLALDSTAEEYPGRVIDDRKSLVYEDGDGAIHEGVATRSDVPDFRDPATLGCLLALVREAAEPERAPGDWPLACTYQNAAKKWGVGAWLNESGKATFAALVLPTYPTEAAALVAALGTSEKW